MNPPPAFTGFPQKGLTFSKELAENNDKMWFDAHRGDYEHHVLGPARDFIVALGDRLKTIAPGIQADPRVNKTLFRINRDTRFRHDKTPYKTHLALWFWEGSRPRMECSGFYFYLEPAKLFSRGGPVLFPQRPGGRLSKVRSPSPGGKSLGPGIVQSERIGGLSNRREALSKKSPPATTLNILRRSSSSTTASTRP